MKLKIEYKRDKIAVGPLLSAVFILMAFTMKDMQKLNLPPELDNKFAYIPAGDVLLDDEKYQSQAFYMSKSEISNKDYNAFLQSMEEAGRVEDLEICKRKASNWEGYVAQSEAYSRLYGTHESYDNFPVVNISLEAAQLYCEWLSEKLSLVHGNEYSIEVRLPSRIEWVRASRPKNMDDAFTWGGSYLVSNTGDAMCNFKRLGAENIYWDESTQSYQVKEDLKISKYSRRIKEQSTGVKSVDAFNPNKFGLYNMNGNVAEMTSDGMACGGSWNSTGYDVRNESALKFEKALPTTGFRPIMVITEK